jgi:TonB family protein
VPSKSCLAMLALASVCLACRRGMHVQPPSADVAEPMPRYPAMLRAANFAGVVELDVPVSVEGRATGRLRVIESTHDLFLLSVRQAVTAWRFRPARTGDVVRADTVRIRFVFALDSTSRCGPAEITRRAGEPWPIDTTHAAPVTRFNRATLRGSVTVCRTPRMRVISTHSSGA